MKVNIYLHSAATFRERDTLIKFGTGIEEAEEYLSSNEYTSRIDSENDKPVKVKYITGTEHVPGDLSVILGSWKLRDNPHHVIRRDVAAKSDWFLCLETPLLNRSTDKQNTHWRIGINGFLAKESFWASPNVKLQEEKVKRLKIAWHKWQNDQDGHILIALQLPGDASLRGVDISDWCYDVVERIREKTNRRIVIRLHPHTSQKALDTSIYRLAGRLSLAGFKSIRWSQGTSWRDDLDKAYCTVTYTSGLAVDSVLAGVPTIACDSGNFAFGISSNSVEDINDVYLAEDKEIEHWIHNMVMAQWSEEEIQTGKCWHSLKHRLLGLMQ